jgi:hypothetical protein
MTRFIVQRRVVARLRTHAVAPVDAFIGDHWRNKRRPWLREKDFGMVVETAGAKALQRLSA